MSFREDRRRISTTLQLGSRRRGGVNPATARAQVADYAAQELQRVQGGGSQRKPGRMTGGAPIALKDRRI